MTDVLGYLNDNLAMHRGMRRHNCQRKMLGLMTKGTYENSAHILGDSDQANEASAMSRDCEGVKSGRYQPCIDIDDMIIMYRK